MRACCKVRCLIRWLVEYLISQVEQRGWTFSQRQEAMSGFYRVHCFKTYGGEDWMKILLTFGHCSEEVINQANRVLTRRIDEKAGRVAATHTQAGPILPLRTRQEMEGVLQRHLEPRSRRARNHAKTLSEQKG